MVLLRHQIQIFQLDFTSDDRYLDIGESASISTSNLTAEYKRTTAFWKDVLRPELPQRNTKTGVVSGSFLTTVRGSCIAAFQGIPYVICVISFIFFICLFSFAIINRSVMINFNILNSMGPLCLWQSLTLSPQALINQSGTGQAEEREVQLLIFYLVP